LYETPPGLDPPLFVSSRVTHDSGHLKWISADGFAAAAQAAKLAKAAAEEEAVAAAAAGPDDQKTASRKTKDATVVDDEVANMLGAAVDVSIAADHKEDDGVNDVLAMLGGAVSLSLGEAEQCHYCVEMTRYVLALFLNCCLPLNC
jgi:hypothetical protein